MDFNFERWNEASFGYAAIAAAGLYGEEFRAVSYNILEAYCAWLLGQVEQKQSPSILEDKPLEHILKVITFLRENRYNTINEDQLRSINAV